MKIHLPQIAKAAVLSAFVFINYSALCQVVQRVETVSTTSSDGTITEYGPNSVLIRTSEAEAPIRYGFSERTTYVDETGAPVSSTVIRSGAPATVYYTRVGDALIADKVMVRTRTTVPVAEPAPVAVAATSSSGVITTLGGDRLIIRAEGVAEPVPYQYTKTTTYVDENGNPVSFETVKSGIPVTVHYSRVNGSLVADRVVVRGAPVVNESRTTTTTTIREESDDDDE